MMSKSGKAPRIVVIMALTGSVLAGCSGEKASEKPLPPRAIKYMKLGFSTITNKRNFAGVVQPGTKSNVAFETNGRVLEMTVEEGTQVRRGQKLARLDARPLKLEVSKAEFTLNQAQATLKDARNKFGQQETLWKKRLATKNRLRHRIVEFSQRRGTGWHRPQPT